VVAADLPVRARPVVPQFAAAPAFTWAGFYGGVNVGGSRRDGGARLTEDGYDGPFFRFGGFAFSSDDCDVGCPVTFLDGISRSDTRSRGWDFTGGAQIGSA
jgi:hypothetical protein